MGYTKRYAKIFLTWFLIPYVLSFVTFHYVIRLSLLSWFTLTVILAALTFLMSYGAKYMTDYLVKIYGPESESNPVVRKMYETKDFTKQKVAQLMMLCLFSAFTLLAALNVISSALPISLTTGLCTFTTHDFIHDYLIYRDVK